jgi:hypothetical protein
MSFAIAAPDLMAAAARDLAGIGSALSAANAAAAAPTTEILAAAADEVSTQIAALFGAYGDGFRALGAQAAAFHDTFVQAVSAGAASYASAEAAAAALLGSPLTATSAAATSFIMGGTFNPQPAPSYVAAINNAFIHSNAAFAGYTPFGLYTPEGANIPFISGLTYDQSVAQGQLILNNAILGRLPGDPTLVVGFSQSATIASLEMRALGALPADQRPSPADLAFMLLGNPDNPNGGISQRFIVNIPFLGMPSYGPTPPDTPYPTTIYTAQYDPIANFPQYPLNIFSTLNALAGSVYVHPYYSHFSPEQVQNAVPLATSPGYGGVTDYFMMPTQNLPLLAPLRGVPIVGNPMAELLQPSLRVLVDMGYNPNGYADYPAPAQLWPGFDPVNDLFKLLQPQLEDVGIYLPIHPDSPAPDFNPAAIFGQLLTGAQQGVTNALVSVGVLPPTYYSTTYPGVANVAAVAPVAH